MSDNGALVVITAHPGDFVWRAGGALALAAERGQRAVIACLSYGERGESARLWRAGAALDEVKATRRGEAMRAADVLGADIEFFDAGDYPLRGTDELTAGLVTLLREVQPSVMLTHAPSDPYNHDHAAASTIAAEARVFAQAIGFPAAGEVIGAPPLFYFEPHQPEMCGFVPNVLLDITAVWERKLEAMHVLEAQQHLWVYYTDLARRRGVQAVRNSSANLGLSSDTMAEAYQRVFPEVTKGLA